MERIDRRELLRRGAWLAAGLTSARLLAACGGEGGTEGASRADLEDLARGIRGDVILPDTRGYRSARLVWNTRFDDSRPAAVIQVADAADVGTVVDFARDHGSRPIMRSGGHCFAGFSTGDGLVVDLSRLTTVRTSPDGERATLGAGATMLPTYRALWPRRMAIAGGSCPTVGITGLASGGGFGLLSRTHGVTCDNLVDVEMVTANGRLVHANERENPDLYWATRGGGGGNFGVITSLTLRLVPVDTTFTYAEYGFPWEAAEEVLAAWQSWLAAQPIETWSGVVLETQAPEGDAQPTIAVEVNHAGRPEDVDGAVADLIDAVGHAPTSRQSTSGPFVEVENDLYCKGLRPKECVVEGKTPAARFPRVALYSKSDFARGPWPRAGLGAIAEWMEKRQRDRTLTPRRFSSTHAVGKILIESADGAVNSPAPDATAFVHRNNLFFTQYEARWPDNSPQEVIDANFQWNDDFYAAIEPYRSGFAYQNYKDPHLEDWQHAYYGSNLARLRAVKAKYDPGDFFNFAQSLPPAG